MKYYLSSKQQIWEYQNFDKKILENIIGHFDRAEDVLAFSQVCKSWREAAGQIGPWKGVGLGTVIGSKFLRP